MSDLETIVNAGGPKKSAKGSRLTDDAAFSDRLLSSNRRFTEQVMSFASKLTRIEPSYTFARFLQQNASNEAQAWAANPAFPPEPDTAAWVVEVVNAILAKYDMRGSRRHILVRLTDPCGHTLQWTTGLGGRTPLVNEIFEALSTHHSKIAECLQGHLKDSESCYQLRIERMNRRYAEAQWGDLRLALWEQLGCFIEMELVKESALSDNLRVQAAARFTLPAPCAIVPDPDWRTQFERGHRRRRRHDEDEERGPVGKLFDLVGLSDLVVA